jgi:urease accessory protein
MSTMLHITRRYEGAEPATAVIRMPLERRRHSRVRATLEGGEEVGILLPHGSIMRHGDKLLADDGRIVEVEAAPELLSLVRSADRLALLRAAYHLGNRHVPLQLGEGWLRYQHDHVLDDMVRALGLEASEVEDAFEPEVGPYAHGGHRHDHGDADEHSVD